MPQVHKLPETRAVYTDSPVAFDAVAPVAGLTYEWSFSDGTKLVGSRVEKSFDTLGFQDVKLTVYDDRPNRPEEGVEELDSELREEERPLLYEVETRVNRIEKEPLASISTITVGSVLKFASAYTDPDWEYEWYYDNVLVGTGPILQKASVRGNKRFTVSLVIKDKYGQKAVGRKTAFSQNVKNNTSPPVTAVDISIDLAGNTRHRSALNDQSKNAPVAVPIPNSG